MKPYENYHPSPIWHTQGPSILCIDKWRSHLLVSVKLYFCMRHARRYNRGVAHVIFHLSLSDPNTLWEGVQAPKTHSKTTCQRDWSMDKQMGASRWSFHVLNISFGIRHIPPVWPPKRSPCHGTFLGPITGTIRQQRQFVLRIPRKKQGCLPPDSAVHELKWIDESSFEHEWLIPLAYRSALLKAT